MHTVNFGSGCCRAGAISVGPTLGWALAFCLETLGCCTGLICLSTGLILSIFIRVMKGLFASIIAILRTFLCIFSIFLANFLCFQSHTHRDSLNFYFIITQLPCEHNAYFQLHCYISPNRQNMQPVVYNFLDYLKHSQQQRTPNSLPPPHTVPQTTEGTPLHSKLSNIYHQPQCPYRTSSTPSCASPNAPCTQPIWSKHLDFPLPYRMPWPVFFRITILTRQNDQFPYTQCSNAAYWKLNKTKGWPVFSNFFIGAFGRIGKNVFRNIGWRFRNLLYSDCPMLFLYYLAYFYIINLQYGGLRLEGQI